MPKTPSTPGLHLRYRIWIAEMNADIITLRIFDDYLESIALTKKDPHHKTVIAAFKKQFVAQRQQIDDLRHEMHLQKMKLAAITREGKAIDKKIYQTDNHAALKKHYAAFRKGFHKMKNEFGLIGDNWVD